jgi:hypothetical protein
MTPRGEPSNTFPEAFPAGHRDEAIRSSLGNLGAVAPVSKAVAGGATCSPVQAARITSEALNTTLTLAAHGQPHRADRVTTAPPAMMGTKR